MRVGVDIVSVDRIAALSANHAASDARVYAAEELQRAAALAGRRRDEFLAGRFAVKEAFVKAVGGPAGIELTDVVCVTDPSGEPRLRCRVSAEAAMQRAGCADASVTISHDAGVAVAVVVLY